MKLKLMNTKTMSEKTVEVFEEIASWNKNLKLNYILINGRRQSVKINNKILSYSRNVRCIAFGNDIGFKVKIYKYHIVD